MNWRKMKKGFVTKDNYAAVPYGNQLMVIYNGKQLEVFRTENAALKFIEKHRSTPQAGTIFIN